MTLRSQRWFGTRNLSGFIHRTTLTPTGVTPRQLEGRPIVGIATSYSEYTPCNLHFRALVNHIRRGVLEAGALPMEFSTVSLGENLLKPTAMLLRNLMAMDVEECIRGYPMDAVVLVGGCDKTLPALLMGSASVDLPTIAAAGGPSDAGHHAGKEIGGATEVWAIAQRLRAGEASEDEFDALEADIMTTPGHCNEMGSASTIASLAEALGMAPLGTAMIPAMDGRRYAAAADAGRRAAEMVQGGPRPSEILVPAAFDNAITLLMALGGSTNAIVHLLALAGRVGVELSLDRFDEISRRTPVLANVRPSGTHLVNALHAAGGVPAVLEELRDVLALDAPTVTGRTLGEELERFGASSDPDVVRARARPLRGEGGIAVLRGTLAPDGAVIKTAAAGDRLTTHRGRAVVFENVLDVQARIDDPDLEVDADSVLVLRNCGPRGGPGMPEWGMLPIPRKLAEAGVQDMVRNSDARMSGTAHGTVVLHAAPEAAVGGPLALVQDGDEIVLDVPNRRLDLLVPEEELERRLVGWRPPAPAYRRGYGALYLGHVMQADQGCDFDFLRRDGDDFEREPLGILDGWIGGW